MKLAFSYSWLKIVAEVCNVFRGREIELQDLFFYVRPLRRI